MRITRVLFILFVSVSSIVLAQSDNTKLGAGLKQFNSNGGNYDYSEPNTVNMSVSIWGYVRYPGKYLIPVQKNVTDLISYAGGPVSDATLEDIRVVRILPDSSQQVIKLNYNELLFEPNITKKIENPQLLPGDMVLLTGEPRFYFKDYLTMTLSIVSTLISLAILILNIARN